MRPAALPRALEPHDVWCPQRVLRVVRRRQGWGPTSLWPPVDTQAPPARARFWLLRGTPAPLRARRPAATLGPPQDRLESRPSRSRCEKQPPGPRPAGTHLPRHPVPHSRHLEPSPAPSRDMTGPSPARLSVFASLAPQGTSASVPTSRGRSRPVRTPTASRGADGPLSAANLPDAGLTSACQHPLPAAGDTAGQRGRHPRPASRPPARPPPLPAAPGLAPTPTSPPGGTNMISDGTSLYLPVLWSVLSGLHTLRLCG